MLKVSISVQLTSNIKKKASNVRDRNDNLQSNKVEISEDLLDPQGENTFVDPIYLLTQKNQLNQCNSSIADIKINSNCIDLASAINKLSSKQLVRSTSVSSTKTSETKQKKSNSANQITHYFGIANSEKHNEIVKSNFVIENNKNENAKSNLQIENNQIRKPIVDKHFAIVNEFQKCQKQYSPAPREYSQDINVLKLLVGSLKKLLPKEKIIQLKSEFILIDDILCSSQVEFCFNFIIII
jgi:hypothetical protein